MTSSQNIHLYSDETTGKELINARAGSLGEACQGQRKRGGRRVGYVSGLVTVLEVLSLSSHDWKAQCGWFYPVPSPRSWASDTFRAVPTTPSPMSTQPNVPQDRHIEILGRSLACRDPDGQLPFDLRQDRAEASLADPDNRRFWGVMRGTPEIFWESLREIAVMLHSGN